MDKTERFQKIIIQYLESVMPEQTQDGDVEYQLVCDTERHHYQIQKVGWRGDLYIHKTYLHFDIKNEKIWIQENRTEREVGDELLELGIPKSDIVIGLQPPALRPLTGYEMA